MIQKYPHAKNVILNAMKRHGQTIAKSRPISCQYEAKWMQDSLQSNLAIFPDEHKHFIQVLLFNFNDGMLQAHRQGRVSKKAHERVEIMTMEIDALLCQAFSRREAAHSLLLLAKLGQRLALNTAHAQQL
tara:strand:- start:11781 stop:12170 length:390 start_codon:yes stop_codon:yes gene_type:complete